MENVVSEKEYNELLKAWNELNNENQILCDELSKTRELVDIRTEESQDELLTILGNIKLLHRKGRLEELGQYIDEQYNLIKKELFDDYQSHE